MMFLGFNGYRAMKTLQQIADTLRKARVDRGLDQKDMKLLIGMTQQQYQRLEGGIDHRVSTLLRILEGLGLELLVVPRELASRIESVLESETALEALKNLDISNDTPDEQSQPWQALLDDLSDDDV